MEFDRGLSARLLRLVAFQGNVGLWDAVLQELQPRKVSSCGAPGTKKNCESQQQQQLPSRVALKLPRYPFSFLHTVRVPVRG